MNSLESAKIPDFIRTEFMRQGRITVLDVQVRAYPDETNYVVFVDEPDIAQGAKIGNDLDAVISQAVGNAFVIVRKATPELVESKLLPLTEGVKDSRATDLIRLISARSRVSEAQPSLSYVRDAESNLSAVSAGRHHLIFGRRGAGKTALLVEAKRVLLEEGALTCWVNMQTLRNEPPDRVFLHVLDEIVGTIVSQQQQIKPESIISSSAVKIYDEINLLIGQKSTDSDDVVRLVPRVQKLLSRFLETNDLRLYVFVDDFYYLVRGDQPRILDMLHGCVRDCNAWLKVASIRHLTRWYQTSPPMGLQTGQDADHIDLDVTLQEPKRAKLFLEDILLQYCRRVGVGSLGRLFNPKSLDRLVLASGAVPRDYLVLASSAIGKAQLRPKGLLVGAEDINQAAGDAAQVKLQELEEDMASSVASAERTVEALKIVRRFCLEDKSHTYFLIGYRDKENNPLLYNVLTDLLDVRLIHLIDAGVSDPHAAGQRSEAFMLDLSQFSGARLKQGIQVLDFSRGRIISHRTRSKEADKTGDTPRQVIAILRTAPRFDLALLQELDAVVHQGR